MSSASKDDKDSRFHPVRTLLRQTTSKNRESEGKVVVKHPLSGGDCARDHKSGTVKRKNSQPSSQDSFYDTESIGSDVS